MRRGNRVEYNGKVKERKKEERKQGGVDGFRWRKEERRCMRKSVEKTGKEGKRKTEERRSD